MLVAALGGAVKRDANGDEIPTDQPEPSASDLRPPSSIAHEENSQAGSPSDASHHADSHDDGSQQQDSSSSQGPDAHDSSHHEDSAASRLQDVNTVADAVAGAATPLASLLSQAPELMSGRVDLTQTRDVSCIFNAITTCSLMMKETAKINLETSENVLKAAEESRKAAEECRKTVERLPAVMDESENIGKRKGYGKGVKDGKRKMETLIFPDPQPARNINGALGT